jgi:MATE family multidrug resistance protein
MFRLAAPLAAAELAWMAMGVVDTIMAGPLGPAALGAASLGGSVYWTVAVCATGFLLGMDTLIAQSYGAGDLADCRRSLVNGIWLGSLLAPLAGGGILLSLPLLRSFGINPRVYQELVPFASALAWSVIPLFLYTALRRYLQALHIVKPITFAILTANLVNFAANWAFIYGHWGMPAMGLRGSAWATVLARGYMALVLLGVAIGRHAFLGVHWRPDTLRVRALLWLGAPAAMQIGIEAAIFALVAALAGKLDEASLAAHAIANNVISVTYMVPLGISSAAAVRVGNAIGRLDPKDAAAAGWAALLLACSFMTAAGLALFLIPETIIRIYSSDPSVIRVGVALLAIAAFFQLGDGAQAAVTGALRGLGDTRTPMLAHLVCYWAVGLPVAWLLCFRHGWGARGLWIGLCVALVLIGAILIAAWQRRMRHVG